MRTRVISLSVALIASMALFLGIGGHASAEPIAPVSEVAQQAINQPASVVVGQIMAPKKNAKKSKPPKWVCSRIYINGKPARPTAVKVWCNGGKTLVKFKTGGMKPGVKDNHSTLRYFKLKKGKYYNFVVAFVKQPGGRGELRVFYYYGAKKKPKYGIVLRDPFRQTPKQSRVLV